MDAKKVREALESTKIEIQDSEGVLKLEAVPKVIALIEAALRELDTQPTSQPCDCPMRQALERIKASNLSASIEKFQDLAREALSSPCPVQAERDALRERIDRFIGTETAGPSAWATKETKRLQAEIERLQREARAMEPSVELAAELLALLFPGEHSGTAAELCAKIQAEIERLKAELAQARKAHARCAAAFDSGSPECNRSAQSVDAALAGKTQEDRKDVG